MTQYAIKFHWTGDMIVGSSALEVVQKMRSESPFTSDESVEKYMRLYAKRHRAFPGGPRISHKSPEAFLESNVRSPLVEYVIINGQRKELYVS